MNQVYLERWTELARKAHEPWQAIAELNVKTLQNFNYLKPEELAKIKKPEELLEKHISLAVENGHKTLDYMQKSFEIFEKAMLSAVQEVKRADKNNK
ncbi:phasin family protein [Legionella sp. D16C41]|uniref:phasin family protein n=1 Tax=Legionella sp. D16C41 TaxID=3402688 RepID=UPI003AF7BDF2